MCQSDKKKLIVGPLPGHIADVLYSYNTYCHLVHQWTLHETAPLLELPGIILDRGSSESSESSIW